MLCHIYLVFASILQITIIISSDPKDQEKEINFDTDNVDEMIRKELDMDNDVYDTLMREWMDDEEPTPKKSRRDSLSVQIRTPINPTGPSNRIPLNVAGPSNRLPIDLPGTSKNYQKEDELFESFIINEEMDLDNVNEMIRSELNMDNDNYEIPVNKRDQPKKIPVNKRGRPIQFTTNQPRETMSLSVKLLGSSKKLPDTSKIDGIFDLNEEKILKFRNFALSRINMVSETFLQDTSLVNSVKNMYDVLASNHMFTNLKKFHSATKIHYILKYIRNTEFIKILDKVNILVLYLLFNQTERIEKPYLFHAEFISDKTLIPKETVADYIRFKFNCEQFSVLNIIEKNHNDLIKTINSNDNSVNKYIALSKLSNQTLIPLTNLLKPSYDNLLKYFQENRNKENAIWNEEYNQWKRLKHRSMLYKNIDQIFIDRIEFLKELSYQESYTIPNMINIDNLTQQFIIDGYNGMVDVNYNNIYMNSLKNKKKSSFMTYYRSLRFIEIVTTTPYEVIYDISENLSNLNVYSIGQAKLISTTLDVPEHTVMELMRYFRSIRQFEIPTLSDFDKRLITIKHSDKYLKLLSIYLLCPYEKLIVLHKMFYEEDRRKGKITEEDRRKGKITEHESALYIESGCDDIPSGSRIRYAYRCVSKNGLKRTFERRKNININSNYGGKEKLKMHSYSLKRIKHKPQLRRQHTQLTSMNKIKLAKLGIAVGITGAFIGTMVYSSQQGNEISYPERIVNENNPYFMDQRSN